MNRAASHVDVGTTSTTDVDVESLEPTACARHLLEAIRAGEDTAAYRSRLATYDDTDLAPIRADRSAALAFWLNLYNAGTQLLLAERPELYASRVRFFRFFGTSCLTVAGTGLSLDTIEQGILRGSRSKYGLGYLPRFFVSRFERRYRLTAPDPRIHFALNCGAASCPPIRSYDPDRIDEQLDMATRGYLETSIEYDPDRDRARLPRVFLWYRGDFGGRSGMRDLLRSYDIIPADARPSLRYRSWDWSREPGKFVD